MAINLTVNGSALLLNLVFSYNRFASFWSMSVADQYNNLLIASVPLITGVWPAANILAPYDYLQIGSAVVVNISGSQSDNPNDQNLGSGFALIFDDNPTAAITDNATP